jgi:hypothetical protein
MKGFSKELSLYRGIKNWITQKKQRREFLAWEQKGKPLPPPHMAKQQVLRSVAQEFGLRILVETGTFYGDMVEALKGDFEGIYSIELSRDLYEKARRRFAKEKHITLLQGDSGEVLERLVKVLEKPALFWLDGHYSAGETARGVKDTPILEELEHILGSCEKRHVIVVDDARCFGTDPAYPSVEELRSFVMSQRQNMVFLLDKQHDNVQIIPRKTSSL